MSVSTEFTPGQMQPLKSVHLYPNVCPETKNTKIQNNALRVMHENSKPTATTKFVSVSVLPCALLKALRLAHIEHSFWDGGHPSSSFSENSIWIASLPWWLEHSGIAISRWLQTGGQCNRNPEIREKLCGAGRWYIVLRWSSGYGTRGKFEFDSR